MRSLASFLAAVALTACGSSEARSPLTVDQALSSKPSEPVSVRGALIADDASVRLCSAVLESYPPQCGLPALFVEGPRPLPAARPAARERRDLVGSGGRASRNRGQRLPHGEPPTGSAAGETISVDTTSRLRERGFLVREASPSACPVVAEGEAIAVARTNPGVGHQRAEAYLVSFTAEHPRRPGEGGELTRMYVDELAWLVIFRHTTQPIFHPYRHGEPPTKFTYVADLAVLIDPEKGGLFVAATF